MTRQNKPLSKMLLQRQIELFQIWGTVRKIWFWKQMFKFHDIICCRLDFLISQLSLNMPSFICFSISDTSDWNCCSLAGSIFANSSETLLNLAIVCCAKRPNCKFGNGFPANFSSPKTRSKGSFVRSTISSQRSWFTFSNDTRNGIIQPTILRYIFLINLAKFNKVSEDLSNIDPA